MGKSKDVNKPKGRMSAYVYFVQTCREEEKKRNPGGTVGFAEFSKECSEKWKGLTSKDKKRFDDMAAKDKIRYDKQMSTYVPADGEGKPVKRGHKKDPNAPKRSLSGFFFFCNEFRGGIKQENPEFGIGDIAKALGKKWEKQTNRTKYETLAKKDKERYEKEMAAYKKSGGASGASSPKKSKPAPPPKVVEVEEEDDEEEEEEEDEDEEEEEEESDE